ncbi:hypothetical protein H109_06140 [Trichophyton interdigitale MR816]|uniref:Uncharacterized protein n=1 Tax=Trichophyton interdigitale (strain MR816) TaxID=1215338 RepID=A0A059J2C5_TRIIM|nr:hypothetical protein H109_06140 [Trichophyton interdigitale MR816]
MLWDIRRLGNLSRIIDVRRLAIHEELIGTLARPFIKGSTILIGTICCFDHDIDASVSNLFGHENSINGRNPFLIPNKLRNISRANPVHQVRIRSATYKCSTFTSVLQGGNPVLLHLTSPTIIASIGYGVTCLELMGGYCYIEPCS